jgi:hypothetical protein
MMEELYGFVFWYNHFEKLWYAIPTSEYSNFFSGKHDRKSNIKSSSINTLIEVLTKHSINIEDDSVE